MRRCLICVFVGILALAAPPRAQQPSTALDRVAIGTAIERAVAVPLRGIQVERLAEVNGVMLGGAADGRPALDTDAKMAETILSLSATTNGHLAVTGFRAAVTGTIANYAKANGFLKSFKGDVSGDDVREGLTAVVSVHLVGLLDARGLGLAAAVAIGTLIGPSQVGARVLEYVPTFVPANGRQFHRLLRTVVVNDLRNRLRAPAHGRAPQRLRDRRSRLEARAEPSR